MKGKNILELNQISKTFLGGKIVANDKVSLSFEKGEIHALVGENGSGKSTLMNILFGLYKQDSGTIKINDEDVNMYSSGAAVKHKIGMVHQHFHLVDNFTVLDNILIGQENPVDENIDLAKMKENLDSKKDNLNNLIKELSDDNQVVYNSLIKLEESIDKLKNRELKLTNAIKDIKKLLKRELKVNKRKTLEAKKDKLVSNLELKVTALLKKTINEKTLLLRNKKVQKIFRSYLEYKEKRSAYFGQKLTTATFIRNSRTKDRFDVIAKKYNINLDPKAIVKRLSVAQRQMVEIMKVLWQEKDIIVLDEPTATLSVKEIAALMKTIKYLQQQGKTIIFISHKLKEVKEIADRISVLRKGVRMGTFQNTKTLSIKNISTKMVGKSIDLKYPARKIIKNPILKVKDLSFITNSGFKALDNVSFEVNEGEIFGLAGIQGNGQEETFNILSGIVNPSKGNVNFKNTDWIIDGKTILSTAQRNKIFSHSPIDRSKHGMVSDKSLKFNSILSSFESEEYSKIYKPKFGKDSTARQQYKDLKIKESEIKSFIEKSEVHEESKELKILRKDLHKLDVKLADTYEYMEEASNKKQDKYKEQIKEINKEIKLVTSKLTKQEKKEPALESKEVKIAKSNLNRVKLDLRKIISKHPGKNLFMNLSSTEDWTKKIVKELNVEGAFDANNPIRNLSGGNQQKFVFGRELLKKHEILLAGHPTRGLDVSAIDNIYKKMIKNASKKATVLYSLELSELMAVCDRMAIFYKGEIVDVINPRKYSLEKVSKLLIGVKS